MTVVVLENHFRKFPVMKYRYEEDDEPDEFFVPYCWSIIYNSAPHIGWDIAKHLSSDTC